jgi:hypothetical protein
MSDNLESAFISARQYNADEAKYETDLAQARMQDQEESFLDDVPAAEGPAFPQAQKPEGQAPEGQAPAEPDEDEEFRLRSQKINDFIIKLPRNLTAGVAEAAENFTNTVLGRENVVRWGESMKENIPGYREFTDAGNNLLRKLSEDNTLGDDVVKSATQFFLPFSMFMKAMGGASKVSQVETAVTGLAAESATVATAFEPHMERFTPLLQEFGLENDFLTYMASTEGTDAENRFKNVVDAVVTTAGLSPLIWFGAKTFKGAKSMYGRATHELVQQETIPPEQRQTAIETFMGTQKGETFEEVYARGVKAQPELSAKGDEIAKETGFIFENPGAKKEATAREKVQAGRPPETLTDITRGGFRVKNLADVDELIKSVSGKFDVYDEGFSTTPAGYFDQKLLVRTEDGTIGEFQVWEENLFQAKMKQGGEDMYQEARKMAVRSGELKGTALPGMEREYFDKQGDMFNLYLEAARKAPDEWQELYLKGLDDRLLNYFGIDRDQVINRLKSSSETDLPLVKTSGVKARSQDPLMKEKASSGAGAPSPTKTEGTPSKSTVETTLPGSKGGLPGKSISSSYAVTSPGESITAVTNYIKDFKPLPEAPGKYFTRPKGTQDIPLDKIIPIRAREKGVKNAYSHMQKAHAGKGAKRKPISLIDNGDGTYTVEDGNSTYANALASDWKTLPATVKKLDGRKKVDEKVLVEGEEKTMKSSGGKLLKNLNKRIKSLNAVKDKL